MENLIKFVAEGLNVKEIQVQNTLKLLEEGNTVPFIARYRKEMTHNLDEEQILYIQKEYDYQVNLLKRKEDVLRLIETQGKLTEELKKAVLACKKLKEVEDLYRPYQQKRKTRATEAIRKGLKPLADWILTQPKSGNIEKEASQYLNDEVISVDEALQGAKDIIAEMVSDHPKFRNRIYSSIKDYGFIVTKAKKNHGDDKQIYRLYYDHKEKIKYIEAHRVMAIDRAEDEKVITVSLEYDEAYLIKYVIYGLTKDTESLTKYLIDEACKDGLKRLAFSSIEKEVRNELSQSAKEKSIEVFSLNLEKLLLQAPLKGKMILGFDPAYRTGCKLAVVDPTGKMLKIDKIYPHAPNKKIKEAEAILVKLIQDYKIEIIAIGNGTASRESEKFCADVIAKHHLDVQYTLVSEAGASVYSASELARKEFPDLQVEERSAVSIARRVLDPLSELIKIDPKSIGVGQYQHDLPKKELEERLDFAILKSVNRVGVDLNTASSELLMHVSGLNKGHAENIVQYRNENGYFKNRQALKNVKRLGDKAMEQASGFLRIVNGDEPLDATSIHPESYKVAKAILKKFNYPIGSKALKDALTQVDLNELKQALDVDIYTLHDIVEALKAPLRDYRDQYDGPMLKSDILEIEDLKIGMVLQGVVRNVVDFGAFVDIGLHEDALIHKTKLSKEKFNHPSEVVEIGDILDVSIIGIDLERSKVSLSLIED